MKTVVKSEGARTPSEEKPWLKYYLDNISERPLIQMTMYQYVLENNKSFEKANAFYYFGRKIVYGTFFEMIHRSVNLFCELGIKKGEIVTIMSMHTPETLAAIYALNYIGAVANMVYMTLSPKEILNTLNETESKALLILDVALERIEDIREKLTIPVFVLGVTDSMSVFMRTGFFLKKGKNNTREPAFSKAMERHSSKIILNPSSDHGAPAVIVYTSGTTGEPKGVVLSSDSINAIAEQLLYTDRNYTRGDKALLSIPPFLGYGISMIHLCVSQGMYGDLFIIMDGDAVGKEFQKFKPKRFVTGPPWLDGIMRNVSGKTDYVIDITGGGAKLNPEKEIEFNTFLKNHNSSAEYLSGYGMTESCSVLFLNMKHATKKDSLGVPLSHTVVKIEDLETRTEMSYNEEGEICVSSPSLMLHYFKNEAATNETISIDSSGKAWLKTGDIGYVDKEGFVFITGRLKRTFYTRGKDGVIYRIFTQRIEDLFLANQYVKQCGVIVFEEPERINVPIAYIRIDEQVDKKSISEELLLQAEEELPEHMIPNSIIVLDKMPLMASGKIDYQALAKLYENKTQ